MEPNFLFIGPDKSGSSWLYEILRLHPDCFVPEVKDIYFFDRHYDRGWAWYLSFFRDAPPHSVAAGELSHDYLHAPEAPARIAQHLPNVRLITTLRDPVERTFSHYLYLVRSGLTRATFEEALEQFPELIRNSRYHTHLSRYWAHFPRAQVGVFFFESLQQNPAAFARDVFDFLGLRFVEEIDYARKVLPASKPRLHTLAWFVKKGANLSRRLGLAKPVGVLKRSTLARLLYKPYDERTRPRMRPETAQRLREVFADEVRALRDELGVTGPAWLLDPPVAAERAT